MTARRVFLLHFAVFWLYVLFALSALYFAGAYVERLGGYYLLAALLPPLIVFASHRILGGCVLTVWEKHLREREGGRAYAGLCTDHYIFKWWGVRVPKTLNRVLLFTLLSLPLVAGLWQL